MIYENDTYLDKATDYIHPIDVKVYVEDNIPYLEYTGIVNRGDMKIKVHFPKIDLSFNVLEHISEHQTYGGDPWGRSLGSVLLSQKVLIGNTDVAYTYEVIEREMTKEQVEKALGYKVKIV